MTVANPEIAASIVPGQRVSHPQFGSGVVVSQEAGGYVRVFFEGGERQVAAASLLAALGRAERVVASVAAGLTSAKIDLLPHQVVLTHRITTTPPRASWSPTRSASARPSRRR
jgi:hypothetical protein